MKGELVMKVRWNPEKFRKNMAGLACGIVSIGGLGAIFFILGFAAYSHGYKNEGRKRNEGKF